MKRLLTYLFIVLGLGLTFNVNANLKEVSISLNEKCKSFDKYDINWYSNKCGQQSSLKSAIKINKKEKKFDIISFYKFVILDDLEKHQLAIKKFLIDKNLKGTLILSPEGLNGTVSGVEGFVKKFNQFLFKNFSFDSSDSSNPSSSTNIPFDRPRVKMT